MWEILSSAQNKEQVNTAFFVYKQGGFEHINPDYLITA